MIETWRCFVAVEVPPALRTGLGASVDAWRTDPDLAGIRWTDPDAMHLTLVFLGATPVAHVADIAARVTDVAARHGPMRLATGGLGAFPSAGRARVVWYGITDSAGFLGGLVAGLRRALGAEDAQAFRPHITLGRAPRTPVRLTDWLRRAEAPDGSIDVDAIHLMRSHLGRGPARYEPLATATLGAPARV